MTTSIPKIATALTMVALVAMGGCGASDSKGSTPEATAAATTTAPEPAPTTEPAPTEKPVKEARKASCQLKGSKAKATLEDNADSVVLTFTGEPIASTDTTGFYASIYDADGNGGQIGAKYLDGDPVAYFTAVEGDSAQTNVAGSPEVDGDEIVMTFPKSDGGLGDLEIVSWNASFTLAGQDVGMCPGNYESQPFPG
jgi:hypothetical protein